MNTQAMKTQATKTKAIVISDYGDASALKWQDIALTAPEKHEVRVRHTVAGFNMIDTYMRKGLYPVPLPAVLGVEAVGVVEALGDEVESELKIGDRVVYLSKEAGAYSQRRNIDASRLIKVPELLSDEQAAASFLKGLTVWALLTESYALQAGDNILVYAAAGGVGSLLCQWAKALGATVIGVVGTEKKIAEAKRYGCSHVINRSTQDIVSTINALTGNQGVRAVYDSLGHDTFETSLDCLAPLGTMVSYGNATGPVPPFNILILGSKGSLKLTRPQVFAHVERREDLERGSQALFSMLAEKKIVVDVKQRFPIEQAALAHKTVESGQTTGATVLTFASL